MIQVFEDSSTRLLSLGLTNLRVAYKPVGLVRTASLTILRFACTAPLCSKPCGFVSKRLRSRRLRVLIEELQGEGSAELRSDIRGFFSAPVRFVEEPPLLSNPSGLLSIGRFVIGTDRIAAKEVEQPSSA